MARRRRRPSQATAAPTPSAVEEAQEDPAEEAAETPRQERQERAETTGGNGRKQRPLLEFPSLGYVEERIQERMVRLGSGFGTGIVTQPDQQPWTTPTTYDQMVLAVRARRKLQVPPAIPVTYQKTAKDIRGGQSLLADTVTRIANTLVGGDRRFEVVPDDEESEKEQERAAKLKRCTMEGIIGADGRPSRLQEESGEPFFRLGVEQACGDGKAIWELTTRDELWTELYGYPSQADYPLHDEQGRPVLDANGQPRTDYAAYTKAGDKFMRNAPFPFRVSRVDPLSYDQWKQGGKVTEAIKIEMRPRREVWPKYGITAQMRDDGSEVTNPDGSPVIVIGEPYPPQQLPVGMGIKMARCVTFWAADPIPDDKGECQVVWTWDVDGTRIDQGRTIGPEWHPLPMFAFNALDSTLPDPAFQGVNVVFLILRIADAIDTLLSMKFNVASWLSMPSFYIYTAPGSHADTATGAVGDAVGAGPQAGNESPLTGTVTITPGVVYDPGEGREYRVVPFPEGSMQILDSLKADLMQLIELIGIPQALRGASPGSGSPGYLVAQLIAQARTALAPVLDNAADALVTLIKYWWWQIEHRFPEGVPIWSSANAGRGGSWFTLKPADIDGRYSCRLQIDPLLPVDKIQQGEASLKQQQAHAISMKRHRTEGLGLDDPLAEQAQIEAEEAQADPFLRIPRRLQAAVRLGYLTPEEGASVLSNALGIPPQQAAQAIGRGVLLGPNGQPLPPSTPQVPGGLPGGAPTPGVAAVPQPPAVAPTPPDVNGLANAQMATGPQSLPGMVGVPQGMPMQPNRTAAAVGG